MKITGLIYLLRLAAMTLSGFFMSLGIFLLLSPILLVFWIYSFIVHRLLKLKYGKTFLKAKGLDIIQGSLTKESKPYIYAIGRYKGKVDVEKYKLKFSESVINIRDDKGRLKYRKFSQLFLRKLGYHIFVDDENFNIDNHFVEHKMKDLFPELYPPKDVPKDSSKKQEHVIKSPYGDVEINMGGFQSTELYAKDYTDEDDLQKPEVSWEEIINRFVNKCGSEVIPKNMPQWQVLYLYEKDYTSMIFKVNHAYTDGVYLLRLYLESFGDFPVNCKLPYNYHQPQQSKRLFSLFWAFCLLPFGLSKLFFKIEDNPFHGPKLSGNKMYMISKPVKLEDVKVIKRETKMAMNSIFFSCMSNAIASYFKMKKCEVEYLVVMVPVSLQDLSHPIKLKNNFGITGVGLPTFFDKNSPNIEARNPRSAIKRLKEVQLSCNRTKADPSFLAIHWLMVVICSLLPSKILDNIFSTKGLTTTMSNLAGPDKEGFQMQGCIKRDFCFFIPDRSPMGMGISFSGFNGSIRVGLMIDRALMPTEEEGRQFLESFHQELSNLQNEIYSKKYRKSTSGEEEHTSLMIENAA